MSLRAWLLATLAMLAVLAVDAPAAVAHPLGNFSVNHLSTVGISDDRVEVRYVLDEAEIPTVKNLQVSRAELLRSKREEIVGGLALVLDGRAVQLRPQGGTRLSFPPGQAGAQTTRLELTLRAAADDPRTVQLRDNTFAGRVGLRSIVAEPGDGTAVRTRTPGSDPTGGLRRYPKDVLESPLNREEASFSVREGDGTLVAPREQGGELSTTRDESGEGFASIFKDAASGDGVLAFLLLAALGWGALHALSPGHGKAMVAAYLAGTRGTAKHAVALGLVVTATHTVGVFALGVVALSLQQFILPEDIYPWLTLISGLMVVVIGAAVLRSRVREARAHDHEHSHDHDHVPDEITWKGILGMGAAAGLIPCPSALVVLLAAVAQNEVGLGLLMIVAFSAGLAGTLTALGLAVVYARQFMPRLRFGGRIIAILPAASAVVIVVAGLALTFRAVPGVV